MADDQTENKAITPDKEKQPETLTIPSFAKWMPDKQDPDKPLFTADDMRALAKETITLFKLAAAQSREQIRAAIEDTAKREKMMLAERMLCDQIVTCYYLNPDLQPEIAEALNVSPEKIEAYLAEIKPGNKETAAPEEQDEQLELFPLDQTKPEAKGLDPDRILPFLLMAQRDGYNRLRGITHRNSTKDYVKDDVGLGVRMNRVSRKGGSASVTLHIEQKELEKLIPTTEKEYISDVLKKWNVSVKMLMDYIVMKLTAQNNYVGRPKGGKVDLTQFQNANRIVNIPLEEWCKVRGLQTTKPSLDKERPNFVEMGETLFRAGLEWKEITSKGVKKGFEGIHPFPYVKVKNNEMRVEVSTPLTAALLTSPVMPYRAEFLQISNRTPNAYLMAMKLAELCNINGHRKAKPSYIVSVSALLDATDYPTKETVYNNMNRRYTDFIINPFLKAMREIEAVSSLKWAFCMEAGKPLSDGMQPEKKIDDFLKAYIKYNFTDEQAFENLQETT